MINNEEESSQLDDSQLELVLEEMYSAKYLNLFLKSMTNSPLTLNMAPQKPLVIIYYLGAGEDIGYCNFVMAPTIKDPTNDL
jgi:hypothetical protein